MGYLQMTRNVESIFGAVVTAPHQIPYTYTATGGEKFISLPFYPVTGIVTINGGMQVPLDNFEIDGNTLNLGCALSKGDVVFCLFDKILSPEDYKTGIRIYKFQAIGGETEFTPDYTSYGVQSLYIGGEYKTPEIEYSYDSTTGKVSLQTALTAGVWVVAEMSVKQPNISPLFDRSIQEIARAANVKDSEVILSTDSTQFLNDKKVVYDVTEQKAYGLPSLPTNVCISSVSNGQLTYSPGSVTVDLTPVPGSTELLREELASNTGTSLVGYTTTNGVVTTLENKLKYDVRSLYDYGFRVGNTGAQNKAALQAAIDDADLAVELIIPRGAYICDPGVVIGNSNIIRIRGAGMYQSVIFTAGEADPLITQAAGKIVTFCEFIDFGLNGNYKANTLLNLTEANHIKIIRVQFANTIGNALVLNGYSNDIEGCRFIENNGNAVSLGGVLNNTNFVNNRVYGNNVGGLILQPAYDEGGLSVRVQGNDFEMNKAFGLMAYGIKGLNIIDNYWERNGENGFNYPDIGGVTVKADVHLIANSYSITPNAVKANDVVRVCGNQQTAFGYGNTLGNQDGFVFTNYAKNLCVEHNEMLDPSKNNALISVYNSHYVTVITDEVHIRGNSRNDIGFIGAAQDVYDHIRWGHLIRNFNAPRPINLLENSMLSWFRFAGSTGSLLKTTNYFNNNYSFSVTDGDSVWATTIDLSLRPELKNKYIWFGAWVNDQGASAKLLFGINSKYSDDLTVVAGSGSWKFVSCCTYIGSDDTVIRATIQKIGSGAGVLINSPVIAELGVSYTDVQSKPTIFRAPSAPTTGSWEVGERVINTNVASGSPVAWTCAAGGTTFLVESNYL